MLQTVSDSSATSNLSAASGSTFTNAGTIQVYTSKGNNSLTGSFTNQGDITVESSATLDVGGNGLTFTQHPTTHGHYRYLILDSSSGFSTGQEVTFGNNGYGYGNATLIPVMADDEGDGVVSQGGGKVRGSPGRSQSELPGSAVISGPILDLLTNAD